MIIPAGRMRISIRLTSLCQHGIMSSSHVVNHVIARTHLRSAALSTTYSDSLLDIVSAGESGGFSGSTTKSVGPAIPIEYLGCTSRLWMRIQVRT